MGNTDRNSEIEEMNIESETELEDNSLEVCEDYLKKKFPVKCHWKVLLMYLKKCVRFRQRTI